MNEGIRILVAEEDSGFLRMMEDSMKASGGLYGGFIPLLILSNAKTKWILICQGVASVLVLIGIMTIRYIVMIGGQSFQIQLI